MKGNQRFGDAERRKTVLQKSRFYLNKISGLRMRSVTWNRFPIYKIWSIDSLVSTLLRLATWIQIIASINHRKKK